MIDTALASSVRAVPRPPETSHRLESEFGRDRDANGHYLPGRGKPEEHRGTETSGDAGPRRPAGDILDLSSAAAGAGPVLARIVAGFLKNIHGGDPSPARPLPAAQRALAERYRKAQAAAGIPDAPVVLPTPDEAARRIVQAAVASYPIGTEDGPDRRRLHAETLAGRLDRTIDDALRDAASPPAAEAAALLARLVRAQLEQFVAPAA
jgi:hypothetical protein